jgi:nucleotide-binding universal stress UspA family protein
MSDPTSQTLVAAIDYSAQSDLVVRHSVDLASRYPSAEVHFLHVSAAAPDDDDASAQRTAQLLEWLGQELKGIQNVPLTVRIIGHEAHGDAAGMIVQTARDLGADFVLVGTREKKGVERWVMGSVADSVVRHAESPVIVVRPKAQEQPGVQIEPACPRCVEVRRASRGAQPWCEQHTEKHGRRHTYYDAHAQTWAAQPWFWDGISPRE